MGIIAEEIKLREIIPSNTNETENMLEEPSMPEGGLKIELKPFSISVIFLHSS